MARMKPHEHGAHEATCTEGTCSTYWACDRCGRYFADAEGNTEIEENSWITGQALGHSWGTPTYVWSQDNSTCTAKRVCARDASHVETESVKATVQTTAATETAEGKTVYTAVFKNTAFTAQQKEVSIPKIQPSRPAVDPDYSDPAGTGKYSINADGTATFRKPAASKATVVIPATVKSANGIEAPVTAIADNAFKKDKKLTTITIGSNILTIGKNAFNGCTKLKTVKGGAKVETIKNGAFSGCVKLSKMPTFKKLKTIGATAFKDCKVLTKFTIGANVKSIGKNAFNGCAKLKTITIKSTLLTKKNVKAGAFKGINPKATIKCPKKKLADYKKFLPAKGVPKTAKIK